MKSLNRTSAVATSIACVSFVFLAIGWMHLVVPVRSGAELASLPELLLALGFALTAYPVCIILMAQGLTRQKNPSRATRTAVLALSSLAAVQALALVLIIVYS